MLYIVYYILLRYIIWYTVCFFDVDSMTFTYFGNFQHFVINGTCLWVTSVHIIDIYLLTVWLCLGILLTCTVKRSNLWESHPATSCRDTLPAYQGNDRVYFPRSLSKQIPIAWIDSLGLRMVLHYIATATSLSLYILIILYRSMSVRR